MTQSKSYDDKPISQAANQPPSSTDIHTFTNKLAFTNQLIPYLLHLADNALILGHRNSEWCGHAPVLELDIAITNIALDLIGQARNFYQYAAELMNDENEGCQKNEDPKTTTVTEDTLAYLREASDFKNCLLVEQPNGDWGVTLLRQYFFSNYQFHIYKALQKSKDTRTAAIAAKALKEVTYHLRWSSEWVIRLGKGTEESHNRMVKAFNLLWGFTPELFEPVFYETEAADQGVGVNLNDLLPLWQQDISATFEKAGMPLSLRSASTNMPLCGKTGLHTEHLGLILTEMQFLQRKYPNAAW